MNLNIKVGKLLLGLGAAFTLMILTTGTALGLTNLTTISTVCEDKAGFLYSFNDGFSLLKKCEGRSRRVILIGEKGVKGDSGLQGPQGVPGPTGVPGTQGATIRYFDNFNDGNTFGWWLNHSAANHIDNGNWRVENGTLVQDTGYDGVLAMIENFQFSSQTDEMKIKTFGPGGAIGFMLWYQDDVNWAMVGIDPGHGWIFANTQVNGVSDVYNHPLALLAHDSWYNLKIETNSISGDLKVYLDGNNLFTHTMNTPNRQGLSGVFTGNAGGAFDDFKLTSN